MNNQPVYPKEDPEYRKKVLESFYKKVRETNWNDFEGERSTKPRGRKPKVVERAQSRPRTEGEKRVLEATKNKFFNFN